MRNAPQARGYHEHHQRDIEIWKTLAQRFEDASRNRLPILFRKHCYPPTFGDRQYRDSMNLSTIRHVMAALVNAAAGGDAPTPKAA
jgi:hypothetical protein